MHSTHESAKATRRPRRAHALAKLRWYEEAQLTMSTCTAPRTGRAEPSIETSLQQEVRSLQDQEHDVIDGEQTSSGIVPARCVY